MADDPTEDSGSRWRLPRRAPRPAYSYPLDRTNDRSFASAYAGPVYVWDIDKTYLASEIDSIRGLLAVPLEFAIDKRNVAGTGALLRALRRGMAPAGRTEANPIYFVSASPPQLRSVIQRKMLIDGVEFDGITFKNQLALVRRGKFGKLREQIGYKLSALLLNRLELPWSADELLFGDDSESDALIYSLYADVAAGRLRGDALRRTLLKNQVRREDVDYVVGLASDLGRTHDIVDTIYINLANRSEPSRFADFSPRVVACWDTFQMALRLYEDGRVPRQAVLDVARVLVRRYERHPPSLLKSAADMVQRERIGLQTIASLWEDMVAEDLAPDYFVVDASRMDGHPTPSKEREDAMLTPEAYLG